MGSAREVTTAMANRISAIIHGRRGIPANIALRLGQYFGVSPGIRLERETGIEPATSSLGSWHSTAELLPLIKLFDAKELSASQTASGNNRVTKQLAKQMPFRYAFAYCYSD